MQELANILVWALLVAGSLLSIAGGIGLLRFPDFYTRIHAAGLTDTGGAGLVIAGLVVCSIARCFAETGPDALVIAGVSLQIKWLLVAAKLIIILFFLLLTSPTSTHALARAALTAGVKPLLDARREEDPSSNS